MRRGLINGLIQLAQTWHPECLRSTLKFSIFTGILRYTVGVPDKALEWLPPGWNQHCISPIQCGSKQLNVPPYYYCPFSILEYKCIFTTIITYDTKLSHGEKDHVGERLPFTALQIWTGTKACTLYLSWSPIPMNLYQQLQLYMHICMHVHVHVHVSPLRQKWTSNPVNQHVQMYIAHALFSSSL